MTGWLVTALMLVGATFMFLAALGMVRFPDVFMRMQAATKAGTVGMASLWAAVAVHFGELGVTGAALLIIVFSLLTAPVGAHMIARSAYLIGVPKWDHTVQDELEPLLHPEREAPAEEEARER